MSEIETPWCPCQEERFEAQYPNVPREDMPYVDGVDRLERVKSRHYYKDKREKARSAAGDFAFGESEPASR